MKELIVNADDLGADAARNAGIFEAVEAGVVTSVSILVNGPAFQDALAKILSLHCRISFGVHLNISEGLPLSSGLKWIIRPNGSFWGKAETHRRLLEKGNERLKTEIRREFAAQIKALLEAGVKADHLDGHQHIHIFPAATEAAAGAADEFGIPWIRIPEEPPPAGSLAKASASLAGEAQTFSRLAVSARAGMLHNSSLRSTDHFRGLYLKGFLSPEYLDEILQALPPGLTELMVHPGRAPAKGATDAFSAFSNPEREKELDALKDGRFQSMIKNYGIQLMPFPEASS